MIYYFDLIFPLLVNFFLSSYIKIANHFYTARILEVRIS